MNATSNKRNIYEELMEGVGAMQMRREGKITLRTQKVRVAKDGGLATASSPHPQRRRPLSGRRG